MSKELNLNITVTKIDGEHVNLISINDSMSRKMEGHEADLVEIIRVERELRAGLIKSTSENERRNTLAAVVKAAHALLAKS